MKNIINYKKILIISFFALVIIGLSLFSVYGFPGSSGGVVIDDGIIAFTKVGEHTWTVPAGVTSVDVLIVGGGGSGAGGRAGRHKGGGGGAGGLVFNPGYSVSPGEEIIIKVGAGGQEVGAEAGGSFEGGNPGESSIFGDLIALGGGAGRRSNASPQPSGDGGSGGGGSYSISGGIALQPTSSTGGYGNQGGSRLSSDAGYGGGGAGNSGNNDGDSPADGKVQFGRWSGGQGLYEVVIGGTIYNFATIFGTDYGEHVEDQIWFAGGGGGGINGVGDSSYGAGGYGGGGRGAYANTGGGTIWGVGSSKGEDGLDNTGGGGGGSREGISGSGGSGIVLIRYRVGSNLQISSLNSGLVGHWSLNEVDYNPSNNTISDLTPYSNHGTNHGATFTTDRFGKEGGAMRFNNGNRIMLQNIEFSEDDNWSFTTWYNLDGDGHNCFNTWSGPRFYNGRLRFYHNQGGADNMSPSFNGWANYGEWEHLSIVKENNEIRGYINGEYVGTIGFEDRIYVVEQISRTHSIYGWDGELDDIRVYDRALSEKEISQLYNSYRPKITPNLQKGLVLDMSLTAADYNPSIGMLSDRTPHNNYGANSGALINSEYSSFNGTSNLINLGNIDYDYTDFSISVWAKSPTNISNQTGFPIHVTNIIGKGNWNSHNNWYIGYKSSGTNPATALSFVYGIGWNSGPSYSVNNFDLSEWNHFVGVASENSQKLYVNGELVDSINTTHTTVVNSFNLEIARSSYTPRFFNGYISNIKAYNRALSPEEVELLYSRGR